MKTKMILIGLLFLSVNILHAQNEKTRTITTTGIIDTNETKSGYRINEFYIELSKKQLDSLRGKKVVVSGNLFIIPGIDPKAKEIQQGSLNDRYFITEPTFTIVFEHREPLLENE